MGAPPSTEAKISSAGAAAGCGAGAEIGSGAAVGDCGAGTGVLC